MKFGKISITVEVDGIPCAVILDEKKKKKSTLLAQTISAFCKEPGVLSIMKLNSNYSFEILKKEDMEWLCLL